MHATVILLALSSVVAHSSAFARSNITTAQGQIARIEQALEFFRLDLGRYPTSDEGLDALVTCPSAADCSSYNRGGYLKSAEVLVDPWDEPFRYAYPPLRNDEAPDLWTLGADSQVGGAGLAADSGNWPGGFDEFRAERRADAANGSAIFGAILGGVLGIPLYLWDLISALRGRRPWRSALVGRALLLVVGLSVLLAVLFFGGVTLS